MSKFFLFITALVLLAGCSQRSQLTSGQSYISNYQSDVAAYKASGTGKQKSAKIILDQKIKEAASIEPILRFPARIGLAKVANGRMADITDAELESWSMLSDHHQKLGEFIPVNVLGTASIYSPTRFGNTNNAIEAIRITAALQHLDAVLIYEINSSSREYNTPLAVADLTIVGGAVLPTRSIRADSNARAVLVDVRNGYPYGSASTQSEIKKYSTSWGSTELTVKLKEEAQNQAHDDLLPKVEKIFDELLSVKKKGS